MQGSEGREGGRLEEVGGGWRSRYGEGRGGEGVRQVRGKSGEGRGVGSVGGGEAVGGEAGIRGEEVRRVRGRKK